VFQRNPVVARSASMSRTPRDDFHIIPKGGSEKKKKINENSWRFAAYPPTLRELPFFHSGWLSVFSLKSL
jgi:hypothetical protein